MKRRYKVFILASVLCVAVVAVSGYFIIFHRSPGAFFEHDGIRLFYSEEGAGEPVILLHGFAVNGDLNWRLTGVAPKLAERYRVIVLDQRGHGLSGKPRDPGAYGEELAKDVVRLMDHLDIDKAHVAGYSLGGYVALKLAVLYPERLLTISCLGAGWQDPADPRADEMFSTFTNIAEQLESGHSVNPVAGMFSEGDRKPTVWHKAQVRLVTAFLGEKKALAALLRNVRGLSVERRQVEAITTPVLVVCGTQDPNYTSAVNLERALPSCEFISVQDRSHPGAAASKELLNGLLSFLREHPAVR